jgi:hypothetical protein
MLCASRDQRTGGVNGRKLRLIAEDDGYDPKQAVLAAQKLVNQVRSSSGRPHRHRAEHGRHAGAVPEERGQLFPRDRRA